MPRRVMEPQDWDVRRTGRRWTREEFDDRLYRAPEKVEFVSGIFDGDRQRLTVLGMLLENLGIDTVVQFGRLDDWKAAVAEREQRERAQA